MSIVESIFLLDKAPYISGCGYDLCCCLTLFFLCFKLPQGCGGSTCSSKVTAVWWSKEMSGVWVDRPSEANWTLRGTEEGPGPSIGSLMILVWVEQGCDQAWVVIHVTSLKVASTMKWLITKGLYSPPWVLAESARFWLECWNFMEFWWNPFGWSFSHFGFPSMEIPMESNGIQWNWSEPRSLWEWFPLEFHGIHSNRFHWMLIGMQFL